MVLNSEGWIQQEKDLEKKKKKKNREYNQDYYSKNKRDVKKRVQKNYNNNRQYIINELGGKCVFCDWTPKNQKQNNLLNFHHRIPMEIKGNKIYHYINNMDILMLMCIKCHVQWHQIMDELGIDDIFWSNI